jgi:hypothetical protein
MKDGTSKAIEHVTAVNTAIKLTENICVNLFYVRRSAPRAKYFFVPSKTIYQVMGKTILE